MATALTVMSARECHDRLATSTVGRVAITNRALPAVVPVTYEINGSSISFRTQPGSALAQACNDTVVAFEIDELPPDGPGWSVLAIGRARLPFGSGATIAARPGPVGVELGLEQLVTIEITQLSGWHHGLTDSFL